MCWSPNGTPGEAGFLIPSESQLGKESARRHPAQLLLELNVPLWLANWTERSNPISQTARSA
jgi:hypothetical protein